MARTPKRLYGPAQLSNSTATRYTVPASTKTILRHVFVSNPTAGSVDFTMSVGADAAGTRLFDGYAIAADSVLDRHIYVPMDAAEIVAAHASAGSSLVMVLSGDELTLG